MYKNFFKIALRNLVKNKVYSFINIVGLAVGMAVTMLIGLWIYDELSFDQYHQNYDNIAQVYQRGTSNGNVFISEYLPIPLESELKEHFSGDFKYVVMSSWTADHILACGEKKITQKGNYFSPEAPEMLTLNMLHGTRSGLREPASVLLSASVSKSLFGDADPMDRLLNPSNKPFFYWIMIGQMSSISE